MTCAETYTTVVCSPRYERGHSSSAAMLDLPLDIRPTPGCPDRLPFLSSQKPAAELFCYKIRPHCLAEDSSGNNGMRPSRGREGPVNKAPPSSLSHLWLREARFLSATTIPDPGLRFISPPKM